MKLLRLLLFLATLAASADVFAGDSRFTNMFKVRVHDTYTEWTITSKIPELHLRHPFDAIKNVKLQQTIVPFFRNRIAVASAVRFNWPEPQRKVNMFMFRDPGSKITGVDTALDWRGPSLIAATAAAVVAVIKYRNELKTGIKKLLGSGSQKPVQENSKSNDSN